MSSSGRYQRTNTALLLGAICVAAAAMPWSCQAGFATSYLHPRLGASLLALSLLSLGIALCLASLFLRWRLTGASLATGLIAGFGTVWTFGVALCERCYVGACHAGNGQACIEAAHLARNIEVREERMQMACERGSISACNALLHMRSARQDRVCRALRRIASSDDARSRDLDFAEQLLRRCIPLEGQALDLNSERRSSSL